MSTERDELTEVTTIGPECFTNGTVICYKGENYTRQPPIVGTAEELDALPAKSVILDNEGTPWVGDGDKVQPWVSVFEAWKESRYILLPAAVLHMGGSND